MGFFFLFFFLRCCIVSRATLSTRSAPSLHSSFLCTLTPHQKSSSLLTPSSCSLCPDFNSLFFSLSMIYFQSVSLGSSCVWTVVLAAVLTCVLKASLCTCQQKHAFNSQRLTEPDQQAEHRAHITADVEGFSWFSLKNLPNKNPQCRQGQPEEHPTELINQSVREPALDGPAGGVNEWGLINSNTFL